MTNVADLTKQDVLSVYSGIDGRCCCGCSGKYSYNSQYRQEAGRKRGYPVSDEDVSDRMITRVLNILRKAYEANPRSLEIDDKTGYVSTTIGGRLYTAYLRQNTSR